MFPLIDLVPGQTIGGHYLGSLWPASHKVEGRPAAPADRCERAILAAIPIWPSTTTLSEIAKEIGMTTDAVRSRPVGLSLTAPVCEDESHRLSLLYRPIEVVYVD